MSDVFRFLAEQAIEEAIRNKDFDNLEGSGKPLPEIQGSAMMGYLRKAGHLPREVMLRKKLEELKNSGAPAELCQELEIEISILAEQRRFEKNV